MTFLTVNCCVTTHLLQMTTLVKQWKSVMLLLSCNADRSAQLLQKMKTLNCAHATPTDRPFQEALGHEMFGLIPDDLRSVGTFLLNTATLTFVQFRKFLRMTKDVRQALHHVFGAPADRVHPARSMFLIMPDSGLLFYRPLPTGTKRTARQLLSLVGLEALSLSNVAAAYWKQLRRDGALCPPWEVLCQCPLWCLSMEYKDVLHWLSSPDAPLPPRQAAYSVAPGAGLREALPTRKVLSLRL